MHASGPATAVTSVLTFDNYEVTIERFMELLL